MIRLRRDITGFILVLSVAAAVCAADETVDCQSCHAKQQGELSTSVHVALQCRDCHGGGEQYGLPADAIRRFVERTPGQSMTFDHGAGFSGRPRRADVPNLCGDCHADVERMNPYGLRVDQLARYWTSGHGKTLRDKGDDRAAVCIDCHGSHGVQTGRTPTSRTFPLNIPDTCATCHSNVDLMTEFKLPTEVVAEYRHSVHGQLLFDQGDTGAPTCATCHGNHSAVPPGFATVGAVCGQCHAHASENFATSIHARQPEHKGCVQCHGGGPNRHFHDIQRITNPAGLMIERYEHLLTTDAAPTRERVVQAIHPNPRQIIESALPGCTACHDDPQTDESLPKLFELVDRIGDAEIQYVRTAQRLNEMARGVLLVDRQRFLFEDAKTHLIGLAPLQHTLDIEKLAAAVDELDGVCGTVNRELDALQKRLQSRYKALVPIWLFAFAFSAALYVKYKRLKAVYVQAP
ncbi:MAG: hypothetical protein HOP29_17565 [Phycisphaerales bacterium]|nr:hypothetical protein [Phycisphaerales bacterium]